MSAMATNEIICPHCTKVNEYTMGSCRSCGAERPAFAIEFSQPIHNMVFLGLCHLRFDNRAAMIVDYAANCMKCEIIGLAGSTVPNPIPLTRFCNFSDMNDRIPV